MGLLDRLVSDLIKGSTGYNPRRIVRRIGGGKLLMAGGAALAGALVMEKMKKGAPGTPAAASAPLPPLPQTAAPQAPPAVALPPLPPLPSAPKFDDRADDETQALPPDLEYAIVRTLIAAALADGHLGEDERATVLRRIDEAQLPEDRVRQLHRDLVLPPTPSELAALAAGREGRETLYSFAALMTRADGIVEASETEWLERLARTFEIPPARAAELATQAAAS